MISTNQKSRQFNFMNFGDEIVVTELGMWGQRATTRRYAFSGCKGHFPDMEYRFTQVGDGSIYKDAFADLHLEEKNCFKGFGNSLFVIDDVKKANKGDEGGEVGE